MEKKERGSIYGKEREREGIYGKERESIYGREREREYIWKKNGFQR